MTSLSHLVVGAACGKQLPRHPWLAAGLAVVSHLVLDAVPHMDAYVLFGGAGPGKSTPAIIFGVTSFLLGLGLVLWSAWGEPRWKLILLCALFGMLPDFMFVLPWWENFLMSFWLTSWFGHFHRWISNPVQPPHYLLGFGTQVAVAALALWALNTRARDAETQALACRRAVQR